MLCRLHRIAAFAGSFALSALLCGVAQAAPPRLCERYANNAVRAVENADRSGCQVDGLRWAQNYRAHYDWCLRAAPSQLREEEEAREDELRVCHRGGEGGRQGPGCDRYARHAVEQFEEGLRAGCRFGGLRWSPNYDDHLQWCRRVSVDEAIAEDESRSADLAACERQRDEPPPRATGRPRIETYRREEGPVRREEGPGGRCRQYAEAAVAQQRENAGRGCGFAGAPWSFNYDGHLSWCRNVHPGKVQDELALRARALSKCRR